MFSSDFTEPYILFLKGVTISDIVSIEDIFNERIINTDTFQTKEELQWDILPTKFISLAEWTKTTNIRCWHCTLKFKSMPWFIITSESTHGYYNIKGNFCSCGCLMGYITNNYSKRKHFDIYHNVTKLYEIFTGRKKFTIECSPSIYCLEMYGGKLTMDNYKKELAKINSANMKN
jgi:hypothetical protein